MARLTASTRKRLSSSSFVYPKTRSYPIHDRAHAIAALRLSAKSSTKGSYRTVRAKVLKRYPSLKKTSSSKARKRRR